MNVDCRVCDKYQIFMTVSKAQGNSWKGVGKEFKNEKIGNSFGYDSTVEFKLTSAVVTCTK